MDESLLFPGIKTQVSHTVILVVYYTTTIRKTRETTPQVCQIALKSFHGRLLPTCNENRGKENNFRGFLSALNGRELGH